MKGYTKVFLKAIAKSSKQSIIFKKFAEGLIGNVPKQVLIQYLDESQRDLEIFIKNVIRYYAKYILIDGNKNKEFGEELLRRIDEL